MPSILKRSRRQELTRSLVDAVKSIYSFDSKKASGTERSHSQYIPQARSYPTQRRYHPVYCLPNELLAHIFVLGAEDDPMFPVVVSHVCRTWRRLALHTPSLWRRITLDDRLNMWHQRILRAKACTLDIQLLPRCIILDRAYYIAILDAHNVQLYMHLVAPLVSRWRSLEIKFEKYAPYLWNAALSPFCVQSIDVYAYHLKELSLIYPGNDDTKEFALFNGYAPKLRRVTLWGIRLTWLPSLFQNLTYLDYTHHGFTRGHEAASEVLHILQISSRLEELHLTFPWRGDTPSRFSLPAPRAVALPRLSTLVLGIEGPEIPSALLLVLHHLSFPAVRTLHLLSRYPFQRPTLFPRLRHVLRALPSTPALEHLYLEHGWLDPRFLFPLLHSLPRLQHLGLHGPRVSGPFLAGLVEVLRAQRAEKGGVSFLKVLELVQCDSVVAEDIVGAFKLRSVGDVPRVGMLLVKECKGVDATGLRRLKGTGIIVRVLPANVDFMTRVRTLSRHRTNSSSSQMQRL